MGSQEENAQNTLSGKKYRDWRANSPATRILKTSPITVQPRIALRVAYYR